MTTAAELRSVPLGQAAPIVLAALAWTALYLRGCARLRGTPRAVPGWRIACFLGGVTLITGALVSPSSEPADELFWAHMVEHLMLGDLAALLIVLGLTGPLLAPVLRLRGMGGLRALTHPVSRSRCGRSTSTPGTSRCCTRPRCATTACTRSSTRCSSRVGINMWMALLGPLPKPAWFGNAAMLGYIVGVR